MRTPPHGVRSAQAMVPVPIPAMRGGREAAAEDESVRRRRPRARPVLRGHHPHDGRDTRSPVAISSTRQDEDRARGAAVGRDGYDSPCRRRRRGRDEQADQQVSSTTSPSPPPESMSPSQQSSDGSPIVVVQHVDERRQMMTTAEAEAEPPSSRHHIDEKPPPSARDTGE